MVITHVLTIDPNFQRDIQAGLVFSLGWTNENVPFAILRFVEGSSLLSAMVNPLRSGYWN